MPTLYSEVDSGWFAQSNLFNNVLFFKRQRRVKREETKQNVAALVPLITLSSWSLGKFFSSAGAPKFWISFLWDLRSVDTLQSSSFLFYLKTGIRKVSLRTWTGDIWGHLHEYQKPKFDHGVVTSTMQQLQRRKKKQNKDHHKKFIHLEPLKPKLTDGAGYSDVYQGEMKTKTKNKE